MHTSSTVPARSISVAHDSDAQSELATREGRERSGGSGGNPEHGRGTSPRAVGDQSDQSGATDRSGGAERSEVLLGSTQSKCDTSPDQRKREARRARFAARAALWSASTLYPVRTCGRHIAPETDPESGRVVNMEPDKVTIKRSVDGRAGFGGLTKCGSVWACPRCSAVIAANRSAQIGDVVRECLYRGGTVQFLTLTLRHRVSDRLADLFDVLHAGWRAVAGSAEWSGDARRLGDRDRFGIVGHVRVVEATVSRPDSGGHGWHLHLHVLLFTGSGLTLGLAHDWASRLQTMYQHPVDVDPEWLARVGLHARVAERWSQGVKRAGGRSPGAAAVDLRTVTDSGAEYLGRYLAKSTYDVSRRLGAEVAAGDLTKTPQSERSLTPFQVLSEAVTGDGARFGFRTPRRWTVVGDAPDRLDLVDAGTAEATRLRPRGLWRLWVEWERASAGRRALAWAKKSNPARTPREALWLELLNARGADAEADDRELAARDLGGVVLGEIARSSWYQRLVWRPSWLVEALEAAEDGGSSGVRQWAESRGIDYDSR